MRSSCAPFVLRTFPPRAGATLLPRRCFLRIAALLSGARSPPAGRFASRVLSLGAWASRRGGLHIRDGLAVNEEILVQLPLLFPSGFPRSRE